MARNTLHKTLNTCGQRAKTYDSYRDVQIESAIIRLYYDVHSTIVSSHVLTTAECDKVMRPITQLHF